MRCTWATAWNDERPVIPELLDLSADVRGGAVDRQSATPKERQLSPLGILVGFVRSSGRVVVGFLGTTRPENT